MMTNIQIKKSYTDDGYTCYQLPEDCTVCLKFDHYKGDRNILAYRLYDKENLIFEGNKLSVQAFRTEGMLETAIDLVGFLTCQPGDTDPDYFTDYTPEQLAWATSYRAESLKGIVLTYEECPDQFEEIEVEEESEAERNWYNETPLGHDYEGE